MTHDELRAYAATLLLDAAGQVDYLTIFEASEELAGGHISDEDAQQVDQLMTQATITVSWPDNDRVFSTAGADEAVNR